MQCAHLVPKAHEAWFVVNRMEVDHIGDPWRVAIAIDQPANALLLREDVRTCFDANAFVFYPADLDGAGGLGDGTGIGTGTEGNDAASMFMAYFVKGGYEYLRDAFHRRRVAIPPDVPVEFLYARFAHAIVSMYRFDPAFEGVPELPEVEVMRGRIRRREQREREEMAYERRLGLVSLAMEGNGGDSGEDDEA